MLGWIIMAVLATLWGITVATLSLDYGHVLLFSFLGGCCIGFVFALQGWIKL